MTASGSVVSTLSAAPAAIADRRLRVFMTGNGHFSPVTSTDTFAGVVSSFLNPHP